ncbi:MAG: hypothetical protein E5V81_30175 [Mesorhizobium sp.]|nr:MAG: hypothetical protein E5V81_30175 [Mesorhizobium sp.]
MHLVLHARPMPHGLVAPRDQTAKPLGPLIGNPDLKQKAAGMELRQNAGIDLAGPDTGMGDRLHLHRVGHNHPADIGRQNPHYRHASQTAANPF